MSGAPRRARAAAELALLRGGLRRLRALGPARCRLVVNDTLERWIASRPESWLRLRRRWPGAGRR